MSENSKEFMKKNFSIFHIIGIILGWLFSVIYWYKAGQFSDNILKNNIILISIWGILLGYILFDMIKIAQNKKGESNDDQ